MSELASRTAIAGETPWTTYRSLRDDAERQVLPLVTSLEGRTFELQSSLHGLALRRGGYVTVAVDGTERLGQVTDLRVEPVEVEVPGAAGPTRVLIRVARGTGGFLDGAEVPCHNAPVRPAGADDVAAWARRLRPARAALTIGELALAPGVPAVLDGTGFARHTFMCGQSGSGKTYSLGVLLERLLAATRLRVVVLDPNSDYVGLGRLRAGVADPTAAAYTAVIPDVAVWRASSSRPTDGELRLRFAELDTGTRAALLGLDPVRDLEEYAVLRRLLRSQQVGRPLIQDADALLASDEPGAHGLGQRAQNLGILDWEIWAPTGRSILEEMSSPRLRCTVVDLGSLASAAEQRTIATGVLSALWAARENRVPTLVVVDEAHNVCPGKPADPLTAASAELCVRIAAEGRKYGLYLLTSTQRPHKIDENVVSQCDNLLLMRMNSSADLAGLERLLSFVPPGLFAGATGFGMGEALVAGRILPHPGYVRMGARVTEEGGSDVPTDWATPG